LLPPFEIQAKFAVVAEFCDIAMCKRSLGGKMNTRFLGIVATALMLAGAAFGHHSFAMFDYNKEVTLVGEVKEFKWTNPHIHIYVKVPDGKGGAAEWEIEGGTPNNLRRTGWRGDTLKPGDMISIVIRPLKNGTTGGMMVKATHADGTPVGGGNR